MAIDTILISPPAHPEIDGISEEKALRERIAADLWSHVVEPATADLELRPDQSSTPLPGESTGKFVVGGPQGDAGLTGRKITWTPTAATPATAAAPSPARTPPRWTARAYAARYVAQALVAAGLAARSRCS